MRKELMSYFGELRSTRLQVFAGRRLPTATFFLFLVFVLFAFHVLIFFSGFRLSLHRWWGCLFRCKNE